MKMLPLTIQLDLVNKKVSTLTTQLTSLKEFLHVKFGVELDNFLLEKSQVFFDPKTADIPSFPSAVQILPDQIDQKPIPSETQPSSSPAGVRRRLSLRKRKAPFPIEQADTCKDADISESKNAVQLLIPDPEASVAFSSTEEPEITQNPVEGKRGTRASVEIRLEEICKKAVRKSGVGGDERSSAAQRRSYTLQFKKAVLKYKETHSGEETARVHGITASTLRGWRRKQLEIAAAATDGNVGGIKKRLKGGGRKKTGQKSLTDEEGKDDEEASSGEMSDTPEMQGILEFNSLLNRQ